MSARRKAETEEPEQAPQANQSYEPAPYPVLPEVDVEQVAPGLAFNDGSQPYAVA